MLKMRRLRTSFSRHSAGDVGVSNLEKVASLPVQAGEQGEGSGTPLATNSLSRTILAETYTFVIYLTHASIRIQRFAAFRRVCLFSFCP